jgi:hypothetical protein
MWCYKPCREPFKEPTAAMMLKTVLVFITIKVAISSKQYIGLMRALNNDYVARIQMHSFMEKLHFISFSRGNQPSLRIIRTHAPTWMS